MSRPKYDKARGKFGDELVDFVADEFRQIPGINVVSVAGRNSDKYSPADMVVNVENYGLVRLQFERRRHNLEYFTTIHLPEERLDFDYLVERSGTGWFFVTHSQRVMCSPKVNIPNIYNKKEMFYDIPIKYFIKFCSARVLGYWFKRLRLTEK